MKSFTTEARLLLATEAGLESIKNQQHRLLRLAHASRCTAKFGECKFAHCPTTKILLVHMRCCSKSSCGVKNCQNGRVLLGHHAQCQDRVCVMCEPAHVAAKDEHWEGVKRKLSFSDWPCRQACEVLLGHHAQCEDRVCVAAKAKDKHWDGVKRKLPFTNARSATAGGRSTGSL
jgi:hypothetical protein